MRRATRGFGLLEVMVAVVVLAVGVAAVQRVVAASVAAVTDDGRTTRALLVARTVLAEAGLAAPPLGVDGGARDGLAWTRRVLPTPHAALREVRVRVTETAGGPALVELVELIRVATP
jgi:prepilin-type N-terminal cleavage/methylation domain-containing protein